MVVRALTATSHTGARLRRAAANKVAIAEAGAIGPLVGMLASPTDGVRTSAAEALRSLAWDNGARSCRCALPRAMSGGRTTMCVRDKRARVRNWLTN